MEPINQTQREAIAELCRTYDVAQLDLFGSQAAGTERAGESDFDFLVVFRTPCFRGGSADAFALQEALARVLGREVDVIDVHATSNGAFLESALRCRRRMYAA
jgi:predicted nucleotidyltransferase